MMKRTYIAMVLAAAALATGCSREELPGFLGDGCKTAIDIKTNLCTEAVTKAYDMTFEKNDILLAYIQTVTPGTTETVNYSHLETLKLGANATAESGNITETDNLSPAVFWDDYSSTSYDLRTDGRGIRLYYGYCYNGGTPSTALTEASGALGWTVATNQSTGIKTSDLLWAGKQELVYYKHNADERGTLKLPYTHAMSKVTVCVNLGDGFGDVATNFGSASLKIKSKNSVAALAGPAKTMTCSTPIDITMHKITSGATNKKTSFDVLFAPSAFTSGDAFVELSGIDGNAYSVALTDAIITAWSSQLESGVTKPGVNYILTISLAKQKISVSASIEDWAAIEATGAGVIQFANDVTTTGSIATALQTGGFDVFMKKSDASAYSLSTKLAYGTSWSYSPVIYWPNGSEKFFFRAVAPSGTYAAAVTGDNYAITGGTSATDILYGTTAAANGYAAGAAVAPRTGDVPLSFKHIMSKVNIALATTTDDSAVNLTNAKITVSGLASTGTFAMQTGTVSAGTAGTIIDGATAPVQNYLAVPQTIPNTAKLTVTLADGTSYSIQLNTCKDTTSKAAIGAWSSNTQYNYTITLCKAEILFSASVQNWVNKTGSGNAELDWD